MRRTLTFALALAVGVLLIAAGAVYSLYSTSPTVKPVWVDYADVVLRIILTVIGILITATGVWVSRRSYDLSQSNYELARSNLALNQLNYDLFSQQARITIANKSIDIILHCDGQFHPLREEEKKIATEQGVDVPASWSRYWERFWEVQFAQFDFYRQGFIGLDRLTMWLAFRREDFGIDRKVGPMSYRAAWDRAKAYYSTLEEIGPDFVRLFDTVHKERGGRGIREIIRAISPPKDLMPNHPLQLTATQSGGRAV